MKITNWTVMIEIYFEVETFASLQELTYVRPYVRSVKIIKFKLAI